MNLDNFVKRTESEIVVVLPAGVPIFLLRHLKVIQQSVTLSRN